MQKMMKHPEFWADKVWMADNFLCRRFQIRSPAAPRNPMPASDRGVALFCTRLQSFGRQDDLLCSPLRLRCVPIWRAP